MVLRLFELVGVLIVLLSGVALISHLVILRLLALVIATVVFGLYLFMRRSLPLRSGTLTVAGLQQPVDVAWDERGVPHIRARNLHDLYVAQGYVTAGDRLWSMDLNRRIAAGRLAEICGEKVLVMDQHFRTIGLHRAAAASLSEYGPQVLAHLEAYTAGVNARIAEGRLPPEFQLLQYRPEPWRPVDSLLITKYMAYTNEADWAPALVRARLVQTVGAEKAAELFTTPPDLDYLHELEEIDLPDLDNLLELTATVVKEAVGSNGWVVGGGRSRSHGPILASAPQNPVSVPALWYQTHLSSPDSTDLIGVSLPGAPGIIYGHNREIAWSVTTWSASTFDLYLERRHPEDPYAFESPAGWEQATVLSEPIWVRDVAKPFQHEVVVTRHGPVLTSNQKPALSVRWTALEPSTEIATFLEINAARSWADMEQAIDKHQAPALTFLFAGREGTIAARSAGRVPIKASGQHDVPVPGWTDSFGWLGYLAPEALPRCLNPVEGYLVVQDLDRHDFRARRVAERIRGANDLTVEKLAELQTDRTNLHARSLLQVLLNSVQEGQRQASHLHTLTAREKRALLMLSSWDCVDGRSSPGPALWHQWFGFLVEEIFRPQLGLVLYDQFLAAGMAERIVDQLILQVALGGDNHWLEREGQKGLASLALQSFKRAVAMLSARQGSWPERWKWGAMHRIRMIHPLSKINHAVKPLLDLGSFAVSGSSATLNGHSYSLMHPFEVQGGAQWRQIVDMGRLEESVDCCAPGQSGNPMSPHYHDQLTPWLKGEYQRQRYFHNTLQDCRNVTLQPK